MIVCYSPLVTEVKTEYKGLLVEITNVPLFPKVIIENRENINEAVEVLHTVAALGGTWWLVVCEGERYRCWVTRGGTIYEFAARSVSSTLMKLCQFLQAHVAGLNVKCKMYAPNSEIVAKVKERVKESKNESDPERVIRLYK